MTQANKLKKQAKETDERKGKKIQHESIAHNPSTKKIKKKHETNKNKIRKELNKDLKYKENKRRMKTT